MVHNQRQEGKDQAGESGEAVDWRQIPRPPSPSPTALTSIDNFRWSTTSEPVLDH